ncbi:MAG: hypothetical protein IJQ78_02110 [Selenomonadaceae bacterium]|nr:hypothetical protein [Selenomonadaceae bacterium]
MPENHQETMPGELETLKKELETTRQQNLHLQKIISLGNISTLSTLIEQYLSFSQVQFKKIAQEIQLTDYSRDNVEKVIRLLEHLDYARKELHVFIDLHEEGIVGLNPHFQKCIFTATAISRELEEIGLLIDMSEEEAGGLHRLLTGFQQGLEKCVEGIKREHGEQEAYT